MSVPSRAEMLALIYTRLNGDSALATLLGGAGRVLNNIPQERVLPLLRFRMVNNSEWDTKDSDGYEGDIQIDIWTDYQGDELSLLIVDRVFDLMQLQPLTTTVGQNLYLRHTFHDSMVEPDGLTHHAVIRFRYINTT